MRFILNLILITIPAAAYLQPHVSEMLKAETAHIRNIRDVAVMPGGDELYFTHQKPDFTYSVIYRINKKAGIWGKPSIAGFCQKKYRYLEPAFSPDGLRLYFVTDQPHDDTKTTDFDIWYIERKTLQDSWSEPVHPEGAFNSERDEFYPSICENGDLYFTSDREGTKGKDDIFYAPCKDGKYPEAISLSDFINTDGMEYNAYVSPDAGYLIFGAYNREDGYGSGDLYISFSQGAGKWSEALNLGPDVNSDRMDYCPLVDRQNNVFYFTSRRPVEAITYSKEYLKEQEEFPGGRSRLFSIQISDVTAMSLIR